MARGRRPALAMCALVWLCQLAAPAAIGAQPPVPSGIGIAIEQAPDGRIVVTRVLPGSPAGNAGLTPGDVILRVDGVAVATTPLPDVARRIAGAAGTRVALDLRRLSGQETRLTLVRAVLGVPPPGGPPTPSARPGPAAPPLAPTAPAPAKPASAAPPGIVRLRPVSIVDQQGLGFEAFRLLVPVDWSVESAVVWPLPLSCPYPAALRARVFDPRGPDEVNIFPARPFVWSQQGIPFFPTGSFYLGSEVRPPVDPPQYVRQYLIPRFRSHLARSRFIGAEPLPDLAQPIAAEFQGLPTNISAARSSFEYDQQGRQMQEDVYAVVAVVQMGPFVNWIPHTSFSFKADKAALAQRARLFGTVVASLKPNLRWYNRYLQLVDGCTRAVIDASNQALVRSRIISQTNDQINDMRRRAFENQQATQDRVNAKFSQYIRGVEAYQNPFENRRVELPSGYSNVWANRSGEYILSSSPSYNPNVGSNIEWQDLKK